MIARRLLLPVLPALPLAACQPQPAAPPRGPAAPAALAPPPQAPPGTETGTVLVVRPLVPGTPPPRAAQQVMAAAAGPAGGAPLRYEILVRLEESGRDVAVFAEPGAPWRPGQRVAVEFLPRPRLRAPGGT